MNTSNILLWLVFLFLSFSQDGTSVDAVGTRKKRKFQSSFKDDADITVNITKAAKPRGLKSTRFTKMKNALLSKFSAETGELSLISITDYEIENYPNYISVFRDIWDERALDELGDAIPLLKFKKKPADWRPKPKVNDRDNIKLIYREAICAELLAKIYERTGQQQSEIIWSNFDITGWPEGVPFKMTSWNLRNILAIYRRLNDINFLPKNNYGQIISEELNSMRALNLYYQILGKFEFCTLDSQENIKMYRIKPWPTCVPQSYKYWDNEAVEEIEGKLADLEFILKPPDWRPDDDRLILHNELNNAIQHTINSRLGINLDYIPWTRLNISKWPEGISKGSNLRSQSDILLLYRALPKMEFSWKSDDLKNKSRPRISSLRRGSYDIQNQSTSSQQSVNNNEHSEDDLFKIINSDLTINTSFNTNEMELSQDDYSNDFLGYSKQIEPEMTVSQNNHHCLVPICVDSAEVDGVDDEEQVQNIICDLVDDKQDHLLGSLLKADVTTNAFENSNEKETGEARVDYGAIENRKKLLENALYMKFISKTGERVFRKISGYEIENFPKYITVFSDVWDEQALDELVEALPLLKFTKKDKDWKIYHKRTCRENILAINRQSIHEELLKKLNEVSGQCHAVIKFSDFDVKGWPENVAYYSRFWNSKDVLQIYRHLNDIKFIPEAQNINNEELTSKRALNLHNKIMKKFEKATNEPESLLRKYEFKPWPTCIPQSYKFWDEESIDEIERILPMLEFKVNPDWRPGQDKFYTDRLRLRRELMKSILKAISDQLNVKLLYIPWKDLIISQWPEGIPKGRYFWSLSEGLLIYRALPRMEFKWKSGDLMNNSVASAINVVNTISSDPNSQYDTNNYDESSLFDLMDRLEYDLEQYGYNFPEISSNNNVNRLGDQMPTETLFEKPSSNDSYSLDRIHNSEISHDLGNQDMVNYSKRVPSDDDLIDNIYDYLALEYAQSNQNDFFNQDHNGE